MAEATEPARKTPHVLVVEDEAIVGMQLVAYFEDMGATVTWAANISQSLSALDEGIHFDAAIVDLNLSGEMSTPVIDELLARQIFTVLCTGYDTNSIEDRFRVLPRTEKPFTRATLRMLLAGKI